MRIGGGQGTGCCFDGCRRSICTDKRGFTLGNESYSSKQPPWLKLTSSIFRMACVVGQIECSWQLVSYDISAASSDNLFIVLKELFVGTEYQRRNWNDDCCARCTES